MTDEIQPFAGPPGGDAPSPEIHVRSFVLQPRSAIGRFAFAAVLVGAGILLFTVGIALALSLAAVAAVTGGAVVGYRAFTGGSKAPVAPPSAARRLDPKDEVFLPRSNDRG